ncbi:MAG: hypothetical protein H6807_00205 [Planctomycetes bacterium]|nr:hypothetical protein [Planctomycetota bacterium]
MNHRLLQRTLFRMFFDPLLRGRVLAGERAVEPGLTEAEFALLARLDPLALAADPGDARRRQLLGNLLTEFPLTAAFAPDAWRKRGLPEAFPTSSYFHDALGDDRPLPLAFADFLLDRFGDGDGLARDFLRLEVAMARCRRDPGARPVLVDDQVQLAPGRALHPAPDGLAETASAARAAMARGEAPTGPRRFGAATGRLLLVRQEPANPWALPEVTIEELSPAVAGLLERALRPLDRAARRRYAEGLGADAGTVESFVAELVAEGVLIRS